MGLQRYGLVLAWVLIIALALVAPVSADIHTIDSPGAVATTIIEDTIYSAGVTNGDVIVLNPGTYYEHDITVPKDITIRANTSYGGMAANTIIDAQSSGRIFMMDYYRSFAIDNLTLQNGLPTDTEPYGGGIFSRSGNLVVTSSSFINCRSPMNGIYGGGGGAIFSSAGSNSLTVTSSSFTGCSAAQYGGAIESELGVTSIDKSSFSGCSVDTGGYGGAVGSWQDTMTITSSSFTGCTGTYGGTLDTGTNAHVTMHFNRIYGTGYQVYCDLLGTPSTVDAANNWWGTNSGPAAGSTYGTLTTSPYLRLGITATPSSITTAQTSDVRANLTFNSAGTNTAGGGIFVSDVVPATFAVTGGTGNVAPMGSFFSSGAAPATFTPLSAGTSTVSATVDGETVSTGITVTAAVPVITGISPTAGPEAGGTRVNITGTSLSGASVTFGSSTATVNTNTATAINMTAPAGTGTVTVTVTTAGGMATTSYEYVEAPEITGISPTAGPEAGGTRVNITGDDLEDVISVTFGSSPGFINGNTETAINTTSPAGSGTVTVTVTTPGGSDTISYTYVAAPTVTSVSPNIGPVAGGTSVTITGTGFTGGTAVQFGGTPAGSYTVNSDTSITATSPAGTGTVDVMVTTLGGTSATSSADLFTWVATPTVTSVSPNIGPVAGGTSVTITGTGFTGGMAVQFGGTPADSYTVNTDTSITATSPAGTGTVDVTVTTLGGTSATSSADLFTWVATPTVTSVSPNIGPVAGGTSVTITGTGFTGGTAVQFGGTAASSFSVDSSSQITAISPAGTGTVDIRVTTPGGTSTLLAADQFTYVAAPTVTSVSPNIGPVAGGTSVTITGTGFTGATAVHFGGTVGSYTVNTDISMTATSPAGTGTVDVTVTAPGGTSATSPADQFTYIPAPVVTLIAPSSGPAAGGTSVIITGTGFTGATAVDFGGNPAGSITVNSDTSLAATSPAGTGTVDITVTTPGGTSVTSSADLFTYIGPPSVTSVSPQPARSPAGLW